MEASRKSCGAWLTYLRWMAATAVLAIALVGAINLLVDPLGVFSSPRLVGLNAWKPALEHHHELARWYAARRLCGDAAIFGNSRAEVGLDPESHLFQASSLSAFNHAIAGSGPRTALRQLQWLIAAGCAPKMVLIGVDFFDFLGSDRAAPLADKDPYPAPRIDAAFLAEGVFSLAGLRDSLDTLLLQHSSWPAMRTDRGYLPMHNYTAEVMSSGHYVLFRQRAEENARNWLRKKQTLVPGEGVRSEAEQQVESFIRVALAGGAKVEVVIYPYHAQIRLMLARFGLDRAFADWKAIVVDLAERADEGSGRVRVWDFSALTQQTLESIPRPGDRQTQLRYYWESGHFRKALGDLVIARVLGEPIAFGVPLDREMLGAWLAEDRSRVDSLLSVPGELQAEVDDIVARVKRALPAASE